MTFFFVGLAFIVGLVIGRLTAPTKKITQVIDRSPVHTLSLSDRQMLLDLIQQGHKIEAIKQYRSLTQSGLLEAKNAIDQLELEG